MQDFGIYHLKFMWWFAFSRTVW